MILPTLEQLAASMALMKARGIQLWFTKLDVSNMFYTCKLPPDQRTAFRLRVGGGHVCLRWAPIWLVQEPRPCPGALGLLPGHPPPYSSCGYPILG